MRAVVDTNVLVSAILRDRLPEKVILCVSKPFNTARHSMR
jgi:predicted nucleic acid-binding protein